MGDKIRAYTSASIRVTYDAKRCIHAAECVRGLPRVFDPERRPWIDPEQASADELSQVIVKCPTGALHFDRLDSDETEPVADENTIVLAADGPLYASGRIKVVHANGDVILQDTRVALCRCGASANKPLCDGRHTEASFRDDGSVRVELAAAGAETAGSLEVSLAPNGPLLLRGPFRVVDAQDSSQPLQDKGALCRCGESDNKPFCDGAHGRVGFKAE